MKNSLEKHKVLLLGVDTSTGDALKYFKKRGCYTIVTDYNSPDVLPEKKISDEYWMIDVADIHALEQACRDYGVTNIFAGNHEFCLDQCRELCRRLKLPFYASELGWRASRDKDFYKTMCIEEGLLVPEQYTLDASFQQGELERIKYPVIVKPNDGNGRRGVYVVQNEEDLKVSFIKALDFSPKKNILVEEYVQGDDIFVFGYIHQGKMYLVDVIVNRTIFINGEKRFGFFDHNRKFLEVVENGVFDSYKNIISRLKCDNGICVFQGIYREGSIYNTEFGFRLDGFRTWRRTAGMKGVNYLELMINLCLGEDNTNCFDGVIRDSGATCIGYTLWGRPGRIVELTGKNELYERDDIIVLWDRYKEGDTIPAVSDMTAIVLAIEVFGDSYDEIKEKIGAINNNLHLRDRNGMDLLEYRVPQFENWKD